MIPIELIKIIDDDKLDIIYDIITFNSNWKCTKYDNCYTSGKIDYFDKLLKKVKII